MALENAVDKTTTEKGQQPIQYDLKPFKRGWLWEPPPRKEKDDAPQPQSD